MLDEAGELHGVARRAVRPTLSGERAEQDPRVWLDATFDAGREALDGGGAVDAIGLAALGPAPILVDRRLEPLTPALLFSLDRRAEPQRRALGVTHDHALPKLAWWQEHEPELVRRAAWALDATGFLVGHLVGLPVMDTVTMLDWELPGTTPCVPLPDPVDPLSHAGGLTATAARRLGVAAGTPVAAGTYDSHADLLAAGVHRPGDAALVLGSTLIVAAAVREAVECEGLAVGAYPGEGVLVGGWTAAAGATLEWCAREVGGLESSVAALQPGAGGLVALPYLAGERTPVWDPAARGVLLGVTVQTTATEISRAFLDAVALSAKDHVERLRSGGIVPRDWRAGGGGARRPGWLQATSDAIGAPLQVARHAGEAAGAAVLALRSLGASPLLDDGHVVVPDAGRSERFDRLYDVYRDLYPALAGAMHALGGLAHTSEEGA